MVKTVRSNHFVQTTGKTNHVIRKVFAYKYAGNSNDLKVGEDKSEGFEAWSITKLERISPDNQKKFIPSFLNAGHIRMYKIFCQKSQKWEGLAKVAVQACLKYEGVS